MTATVHTIESLRKRIDGEDKIVAEGTAHEFVTVPPVKRIHCADGFSISVQAGELMYAKPRRNHVDWTHVELGFPSAPIPEFEEWRDGGGPDEKTVFGYVPIEKVVELINAHGGEVAHEA